MFEPEYEKGLVEHLCLYPIEYLFDFKATFNRYLFDKIE